MNTSGGNRKSMDDVLASIRRIIGADKKDGYDDMPEPDLIGRDEPPLALGAPIAEGDPAKTRAPEAAPSASAPDAPDPLSLTPNMRVDFSKLTEEDPPRPEPAAVAPPPPSAPAMPEPEPELADEEAVVIDEAALEDMIRRIVREEIAEREAGAEADAAERREEMRQVVREELMGPTGQNISRNVQKMIQAEVAKLLAEKG